VYKRVCTCGTIHTINMKVSVIYDPAFGVLCLVVMDDFAYVSAVYATSTFTVEVCRFVSFY
jgi:hypothetical protein